MDWLEQFFTEYKEWLLAAFGGICLAAITWVSGLLRWLWQQIRRWLGPPPPADTDAIVERLTETAEQLGAYKEREKGYQETIRELTSAVEAVKQQAGAPDAPPGIKAALKQLAQGETEAAEAIFEQVLERKKGEAASKEAAAAARHIGALAFLHNTKKALSAYAQAVELDPEDPDGWNILGLLRHRTGKLDAAIQAFERVLALGNKADDKRVIAVAYGNLGIVYRTRGELAKAEEHHLKSLAIEKELGRKEGMANDYGNLGSVYLTRGDLEKAEEHYRESLALHEELGRKEGMANAYSGLGLVYRTRGDLDKAEENHRKSLALHEELGRKEGIANQYSGLGLVYKARGELGEAKAYHWKSLALHEELDHKEGMASDYGNLGNVYFTRGDLAKAEEYHLKALAINKELGRKEGMASDYSNLGIVYEARGDLQKACEAWAKSRRLFEELGAAGQAEQARGWMQKAGCGREEDGEG